MEVPDVPAAPGKRRWSAVLVPSGLLVLALLAYSLLFQEWVYGDGPQFIDDFLFEGKLQMHVLYIPAARLLARLFEPSDPIASLRWVSILGGSIGVAGVYGLSRSFGAAPARAVACALLAGTTPAIWFFATTIEVHAFHFGAVSACAYLATRAPWKRTAPALLWTAGLAPLLHLTHKSGVLLALGWLALVLHVRARTTQQRTGRSTVLLVGAAVAAGYGASILASILIVPVYNDMGRTLDFIAKFQRGPSAAFFRDGVLLGLGCLLPLALVGFRATSRAETAVFAALVVPTFLFFSWYGESNYGGYFAASVPFLAVLCERALPRGRAWVPLACAAVAGQLALSLHLVRDYARTFSMEDRALRVAAVRAALGDGGPQSGTLVSLGPSQPITLDLPGIRERNTRRKFLIAAARGMPPEESARELIQFVRDELCVRDGRMLVDLNVWYPAAGKKAAEYMRAFETAITSELGPARRDEPRFPMIVVR